MAAVPSTIAPGHCALHPDLLPPAVHAVPRLVHGPTAALDLAESRLRLFALRRGLHPHVAGKVHPGAPTAARVFPSATLRAHTGEIAPVHFLLSRSEHELVEGADAVIHLPRDFVWAFHVRRIHVNECRAPSRPLRSLVRAQHSSRVVRTRGVILGGRRRRGVRRGCLASTVPTICGWRRRRRGLDRSRSRRPRRAGVGAHPTVCSHSGVPRNAILLGMLALVFQRALEHPKRVIAPRVFPGLSGRVKKRDGNEC